MKEIIIKTTVDSVDEAATVIKTINEKTQDLFPASPVFLEITIR